MKLSRLVLRMLGAIALVALIATSLQLHAGPANAARSAASELPKAGLDLANLDTSCKACDDFFRFATGGWQKAHPIPAGYSSWDSFSILAEDNRNVLHRILDDAAQTTTAPDGSNEQKIGAFYRSCMDESAIDAAGLTPIAPELARIEAVADSAGLSDEFAHLQHIGITTPLPISAQPDAKNSAQQIADIGFGGLGLPDRDYYFRADEKSQAVRTAYATYVTQLLTLAGDDATKAAAETTGIMTLETSLAQATPTRTQLRDPKLTDHPMPFANLSSVAPDFPWAAYTAALGAPSTGTVNVELPAYVKTTDALRVGTSLDTWKAYLRFHLLNGYASALSKPIADASFAFHSTALFGVKAQLPRWKRCVAATDVALGDALGQVYVAEVFPPAAKARITALVNNLHAVLHDDIKTLSWMSAPTKARAEVKLAAITKKVGYPNTWRSYAKLPVRDIAFAGNVMSAREFESDDDIAHIGKPTDRTRWGMTIATVNAYYEPANNEIVFPAGILAPPFFSNTNDDAVNYGAAGAVIGHETTHGFDDEGRLYDSTGNLSDWWTPADTARFTSRAQCVIDQFNGYTVDGVHIAGRLVTGEAIADLGGLTIAYKAFERTPQFKAHKKIGGYTPEQRFFLSFANVWKQNERAEAARSQALGNEHPDNRYRVIGTLSNMPEFRAAFHCVTGDKMVRPNACQIW